MNFSFMRKCIYECIYNVCLNESFFMRKCIYECIYNVCLNESFFYKKSIYECMIFLRFIFVFFNMHAKKNLECIYKWNFWECVYIVQNARKIHKIFCECTYIDTWKSMFF